MPKKISFVLFFFLILSGCYTGSMDYQFGWTTRWINGNIKDTSEDPLASKSFIILLEYHSQFIQFEGNAPIYVPKARLIFPDPNGHFKIPFHLDASAFKLSVVAEGYAMQSFPFQRQIGVGDLHYQIRMQATEVWKNEFLIHINPFLENFILEQRYKMPETQQLFIGEWLSEQRKKLFDKPDS